MYQVTAPLSSNPLDLSGNRKFKDQLKDAFTNWYVNLVASVIQECGDTNTKSSIGCSSTRSLFIESVTNPCKMDD